MSLPNWGVMSSELLGQVVAYVFGCVSGAAGGMLWRRMREVEDRVTVLEEHEQEQEENGPHDI
jgi:hypothetical protein